MLPCPCRFGVHFQLNGIFFYFHTNEAPLLLPCMFYCCDEIMICFSFVCLVYVRLTCMIYLYWWFENGQNICSSCSKFHLRECVLRVGSLWKHGLINVSLMVFRKFLNSPKSIVISSFHFILAIMPSRVTEKTMLREGCASIGFSTKDATPQSAFMSDCHWQFSGLPSPENFSEKCQREVPLASMADAWTQLAVSLSLPTGSTVLSTVLLMLSCNNLLLEALMS